MNVKNSTVRRLSAPAVDVWGGSTCEFILRTDDKKLFFFCFFLFKLPSCLLNESAEREKKMAVAHKTPVECLKRAS